MNTTAPAAIATPKPLSPPIPLSLLSSLPEVLDEAADSSASGVFVAVGDGVTVAKGGRVGTGVSVPVGVAVAFESGPSSVAGRVGVQVGGTKGGSVGSGRMSGVEVAGTRVGVELGETVVLVGAVGLTDGGVVAVPAGTVGVCAGDVAVLVEGTLVFVGGTGVFVACGAVVAVDSGVWARAWAGARSAAARQHSPAATKSAEAAGIRNARVRYLGNI